MNDGFYSLCTLLGDWIVYETPVSTKWIEYMGLIFEIEDENNQ